MTTFSEKLGYCIAYPLIALAVIGMVIALALAFPLWFIVEKTRPKQ